MIPWLTLARVLGVVADVALDIAERRHPELREDEPRAWREVADARERALLRIADRARMDRSP